MPTPTYTPLATITLASAVSTVSFNNIPNIYRDLIVSYSFRNNSTSGRILGRFNSDAGSNYPQIWMQNDGSSGLRPASSTLTGLEAGFNSPAGAVCTVSFSVIDYSATNKHKNVLLRINSQNPDEVVFRGFRWGNTAAINSITLVADNSNNMTVGSIFSLYGVVG